MFQAIIHKNVEVFESEVVGNFGVHIYDVKFYPQNTKAIYAERLLKEFSMLPDNGDRKQGSIVRYISDRGYGFIKSIEYDSLLFFHFRNIEGGVESILYKYILERTAKTDNLEPNIDVSFKVRTDEQGRLQAFDIRTTDRERQVLSNLQDFLAKLENSSGLNEESFAGMASMAMLPYISEDTSVRNIVISKVFRSVDRWNRIVNLAQLWFEATNLMKNPSVWSKANLETMFSFSSALANTLFLETKSFNYDKAIPAFYIDIEKLLTPMNGFRNTETIRLIIMPNAKALIKVIQNDPFSLSSDYKDIKVIILLQEDEESLQEIKSYIDLDSHGIKLAILRQKAIIETVINSNKGKAISLGRLFRSIFPSDFIQPYEIGSLYNEIIFAGRKNERNRILDNSGSFAVYGGRRIGKSWFLKDIVHRCKTEPYSKRFIGLYISLQTAKSSNEAIDVIEQAITRNAPVQVPESRSAKSLTRLSTRLDQLHEITRKTVLLALDEVDDVLRSEDKNELFGRLRQLDQTYENSFKFVFAGFKELIKVIYEPSDQNPFFNWVSGHFPLECLRKDEAITLITAPLNWAGLEFNQDEIVETIYEITSGHPYYIQTLCHDIVNARIKSNAKILLPQNIEKLASEKFFYDVFDIFTANLTDLQLLIGKIFSNTDKYFAEEDIINSLKKDFSYVITKQELKKEMQILQACSIFTRTSEGYKPVLRRINHEFFERQDDQELAVICIDAKEKKQNGIQNS